MEEQKTYSNEDLAAELAQQKELVLHNYQILTAIRRSARISLVFSVLRLLIILIPLILILIYVPPIIQEYLSTLSSISETTDSLNLPQGFDFGALDGLLER